MENLNFVLFWYIIPLSDKSDEARSLNGVYTGGCAALRKEVAVMKKYILRIIFFVIVFLITFTVKVK